MDTRYIVDVMDRNLQGLRVTMRKHPSSLKLSCPKLEAANAAVTTEAVTLYDGPVRQVRQIS